MIQRLTALFFMALIALGTLSASGAARAPMLTVAVAALEAPNMPSEPCHSGTDFTCCSLMSACQSAPTAWIDPVPPIHRRDPAPTNRLTFDPATPGLSPSPELDPPRA
jgi:hypothetical protein